MFDCLISLTQLTRLISRTSTTTLPALRGPLTTLPHRARAPPEHAAGCGVVHRSISLKHPSVPCNLPLRHGRNLRCLRMFVNRTQRAHRESLPSFCKPSFALAIRRVARSGRSLRETHLGTERVETRPGRHAGSMLEAASGPDLMSAPMFLPDLAASAETLSRWASW